MQNHPVEERVGTLWSGVWPEFVPVLEECMTTGTVPDSRHQPVLSDDYPLDSR